AVIEKEWKKGDVVEYSIPMTVNYIVAGSQLKYDVGRIAIQRGPILYCVEGADNSNEIWNIVTPLSTVFTPKNKSILTEPVVALEGEVLSAKP
ncbi:glycoside hydrolase family 127 protein, partial [Klebsiella pneumoniae]|nr:glycoside hydrolase family 127 protein [Klebsiella pneumoniae]